MIVYVERQRIVPHNMGVFINLPFYSHKNSMAPVGRQGSGTPKYPDPKFLHCITCMYIITIINWQIDRAKCDQNEHFAKNVPARKLKPPNDASTSDENIATRKRLSPMTIG